MYPGDVAKQREWIRAKRHYNTLVAEDFVEQIVNSAPPLTSEARTRLAALLAPPARRRRSA
jgi:hypothetical protein